MTLERIVLGALVYQAGIPDSSLLIALEPEAASLCCRHIQLNNLSGSKTSLSPFAPKSKYLVFDAGGEYTKFYFIKMFPTNCKMHVKDNVKYVMLCLVNTVY